MEKVWALLRSWLEEAEQARNDKKPISKRYFSMVNTHVETHKHEYDRLPLLYRKVLATLEKHGGRGRVIPFPETFRILSWGFRLNKNESFVLFQELQAQGVLELQAYHGVVLK